MLESSPFHKGRNRGSKVRKPARRPSPRRPPGSARSHGGRGRQCRRSRHLEPGSGRLREEGAGTLGTPSRPGGGVSASAGQAPQPSRAAVLGARCTLVARCAAGPTSPASARARARARAARPIAAARCSPTLLPRTAPAATSRAGGRALACSTGLGGAQRPGPGGCGPGWPGS